MSMKIQYILLFLVFNFFTIKAQESLFNGKNLDGWTIHGTELWYVEDGLLVCESGPDKAYGYLSTDKYYDDFELTLEFKQEANGNSGVFIRSTVEGTKVSGWQVEVAIQTILTLFISLLPLKDLKIFIIKYL